MVGSYPVVRQIKLNKDKAPKAERTQDVTDFADKCNDLLCVVFMAFYLLRNLPAQSR